jgi:hypothetical protein
MHFPNDFMNNIPDNFRIIRYKNELYVGGSSYDSLGNDIVRYDGVTWKSVGGGLLGGGGISDMVVYKDELYVCGYFKASDGNAGNKIMRWDGSDWKGGGGELCGPSGIPTGMVVYQDKLILVGGFDCIGDELPVSNIAAWDGAHWCSFGNSHFDNNISCVGVYNGELYVGGGFHHVGGYPVHFLAKWVGDHNLDTCSALVSVRPDIGHPGPSLTLSPNPVTDQLQIQWSDGATPIGWNIYDASGHEVTRAASDSSLQNGPFKVPTAVLPTGLFMINLQFNDVKNKSSRFIKI